jgi:hypothetical protein
MEKLVATATRRQAKLLRGFLVMMVLLKGVKICAFASAKFHDF